MKRLLTFTEIDASVSYRTPTDLKWFPREDTSTLVQLIGFRLRLPPADKTALPASAEDTTYVSCYPGGEVKLLRHGDTDHHFTVGFGSAEAPQTPLQSVPVVWSGFQAELGIGAKLSVMENVSELALSISNIQVLSLMQGKSVISTQMGLGYAVSHLLEMMELVSYDVTIADTEREDDDEQT